MIYSVDRSSVHWQYFCLLEVSLFTSLLFYMFKVRANVLQKIQDSFPCTYMNVHVSTSYFKKRVSLYTKQFSLVGCGQISLLLVLKTLSFNSSERQQFTLQWNSLVYFLELLQIHVCLLEFLFHYLYMYIVSTYIN